MPANQTRAAADLIEAARERHVPVLTIAEASRRAGISAGFLCDIENGKRGASPDVRKRLAAALNVPTSAIEALLVTDGTAA